MDGAITYNFGRLKAASIMNCLCFFALCVLGLTADDFSLRMILGIVIMLYALSLVFWWTRLKQCAALIGARSSPYFLLIVFPVFGQMVACHMLEKAARSTYFL